MVPLEADSDSEYELDVADVIHYVGQACYRAKSRAQGFLSQWLLNPGLARANESICFLPFSFVFSICTANPNHELYVQKVLFFICSRYVENISFLAIFVFLILLWSSKVPTNAFVELHTCARTQQTCMPNICVWAPLPNQK
jgi:hypothetical protein